MKPAHHHLQIDATGIAPRSEPGLRIAGYFSYAVIAWLWIHQPLGAAPVDFAREVRPIFQQHCYACHGPTKQKSGLRLDVKAAAFIGGDGYGPSIVPEKATESPLMQLTTSKVRDERMPPDGDGLSAAEIATLARWIDEGAIWPAGIDEAALKDKRDHWSFQPLKVDPGNHSIDSFIAARLAASGLARSPETDRASWLRRVSLDLIGLPPTIEQVKEFVDDARDDAHQRVVARLLASPRYGERWAQHWLDVVRYADTHGFEVNTERPNAWPYRDYVIDALNADTPYDQFIREQLAGDALGKDAATGFLVTASVLLPGQIGKDEPSKRLARQDSLDEIVNNISQTFLGLSVGCARCHDHKFDPVTARDYYSMQALVAGVEYKDRDLRTPEAETARQAAAQYKARLAQIDQELARFVPLAKSGAERPPVNARENSDRFPPVTAKRLRFTIQATNSLEPCIDELEVFNTAGENVALASQAAIATSSGEIVVADRHELKHIHDGLYGNSRSWMSNEKGKGWVILEFELAQPIERVVWGRDRQGKYTDRLATDYAIEVADQSGAWIAVADSTDRRAYVPKDKTPLAFSTKGLSRDDAKQAGPLIQEKQRLNAQIKTADNAQKVFAGTFRAPDKIHLLNRGDPEQPKEEVVPAVLSSLGDVALHPDTPEQTRRLALADWIASPLNPLTARVMVNRIWQGHFGVGIVETPSDFGNAGMKPTHPELLDWLADEFIRSGWSVKHMHRLIVLSQTYRQASGMERPSMQVTHRPRDGAASRSSGSASPELARSRSEVDRAKDIDRDARLLWRFPSRRIEAETIRDSMLAVSGQLNLAMYGRGYDLFNQRGGLSGFNPVETFAGDGLRRMIYAHKVRRETEAIFGAFDCPDAGQSTALRRESTTPIQALNLFNSRFTLDRSEAFAARVKSEVGEDLTQQIYRAYQHAVHRDPDRLELDESEPVVREHGLASLCRALFNCNEFLFLP